MEFEAPPLEQQLPIYFPLKEGVRIEDDSDSDSQDDGVKKIAKQYAQHKEPGTKKVSLHTPHLRSVLIDLF